MANSRIAVCAFLLAVMQTAAACNSNKDLEEPSAIQVLQPTVSTLKTDGFVSVTVLGTFKNTTATKVDNLIVEAKLTDEQGKVIDVLSQPVYGIAVPAGEEVAFRINGQATAAQSAYAGVQIRVTSGEAHFPQAARPLQKQNPMWLELLISWGPMLLLILAWALMMRRYNGKGSPQAKLLVVATEQNALLVRQIAAIEAIAARAAPPQS